MSSRLKKAVGILLLAVVMISGAGCFSWDSSGNRDYHDRDRSAVAQLQEDFAEQGMK